MAGDYHRVATRCDRCSSYFTVPPGSGNPLCPCGGALLAIDHRAESARLSYIPMNTQTQPEPPKATHPMANEFAVHQLNPTGIARAERMAKAFDALVTELDAIGLVSDDGKVGGRERALVITHLQTANFYAKRAMALNPFNQFAGPTEK